MPSITREQPPRGSPTRSAIPQPISAPDGLPVTCSLTLIYRASLLVAALVALASAVGLTWAADDTNGGSSSVLISRGADLVNLLLVPLLLGAAWSASRGSLAGLLLWPGARFYTLYAYVPYAVSAPVSRMALDSRPDIGTKHTLTPLRVIAACLPGSTSP